MSQAALLTPYRPENRDGRIHRPGLDEGGAAASLTTSTRQLHHEILTVFTDTSRSPWPQDFAGIDHDPALRKLTERDLLVVDKHGRIRAV
ncbi:hypothetical protein [Lentzea flaviverrucosa]|uniref:Uncharacterized protein n=1 Tax=Lentzea flaviverrucosa TaxID=200379 RepID=A0A1H9ERP5_9PSEU|nr:hypothetical protein [Lentzea flaviverrucosa]RDI35427.1 hypothetical protein DFR72_1011178 [Lentzea flaviverrucosa]SEQ27678.1 hypothetical protein SAMN05216195_10239 [Lentzea flaviverrucosa]